MLHLISLSILNLSGVPSIVFGLFGFGLFVLLFDWCINACRLANTRDYGLTRDHYRQ